MNPDNLKKLVAWVRGDTLPRCVDLDGLWSELTARQRLMISLVYIKAKGGAA